MNDTIMLQKPWVSFCMSTYKRPEFLRKQIEGILQQTFTDFEIVISDNDPEGSGRDALSSFSDNRIRYEVNKENLGMVKSFNHSLAKAKGEYIVMITDDDPVYPDMLQTLHGLYKEYPGFGVYQGGCEILCYTTLSAKVMRAKVGINSCLSSDMDLNEVKLYSADEFPHVFFSGKLGSLLLWSVAIVRRDILLKNGGMPDYGTEFFTDHAYNVVNCSSQGVVYINRALGHQAIHGGNFGFTNLKNIDKYKKIPQSFANWVEDRMKNRNDWPELKSAMHVFIGRSLVEFSLFIRKSLTDERTSLTEFSKAVNETFSLPYLKKWKWKYILMSKFPAFFQFMLQVKQKIAP